MVVAEAGDLVGVVGLAALVVVADSVAAAAALPGDHAMAKMTLDDLVSQLRAVFGGELRSVVLYGSAAAGEHIPKRSDYNAVW